MASVSRRTRHGHFQGQISLEHAFFCVECEVIYAGTVQCPRCGGGAVWPLAEWLHSTRPSLAAAMPLQSTAEEAKEPGKQRTLPAA